jgi:hypothetical protein
MSASPYDQNFGEYMSRERCLTAAVPVEEATVLDETKAYR